MLYFVFFAALALTANGAPSGKIIGGTEVDIKDYPYQVSLILQFEEKIPFCGGAIISDRHILTAAHCFILHSITPLDDVTFVHAGSTFATSEEGSAYAIEKLYIHEDFKNDNILNDVALVKLKTKIQFDEFKKPIPLFDADEDIPAKTMSIITGWGDKVENSTLGGSEHLMMTEVPIVDRQICKEIYNAEKLEISPSQICAGFLGIGGHDTCQGDSGGPFAIDGRLAGIVSFGKGCGRPNFPGVYTNVAYFRRWIDEKMKLDD